MTGQQSRPGGRSQAASSAFRGASLIVEGSSARHEPSAWLREIESRRLAELDEALAIDPPPAGVGLFVLAITRHTSPGEREDRTCDRCRTYCGPEVGFNMISSQPRPRVWLVGGLCDTCLALEVGTC